MNLHSVWTHREPKWFDTLDHLTNLLTQAAAGLVDLVEHLDRAAHGIQQLAEWKQQSERAGEKIVRDLCRTSGSLLAGEHLPALATDLVAVVAGLEESAFRLVAFRLQRAPEEARRLAFLIQNACHHLQHAVRAHRENLGVLSIAEEVREVLRLGDEADDLYRQAEMNLFANPPAIMTFIPQREVYSLLKDTVDACCEVANVLKDLVAERV